MILDGILLIFQGFLEVLLLPLTTINIAIDFIGSIPIVAQFLQLVAYVLPWANLLPVFILTITLFLFRIVLALIKLVLSIIK